MDFLTSLFDFSFKTFITPKLVRILYILLLALIAIGTVLSFIGGLATLFSRGGFIAGVGIIIATPIFAVIYLIMARVSMEITIVIFQIAEHLGDIARNRSM